MLEDNDIIIRIGKLDKTNVVMRGKREGIVNTDDYDWESKGTG